MPYSKIYQVFMPVQSDFSGQVSIQLTVQLPQFGAHSIRIQVE